MGSLSDQNQKEAGPVSTYEVFVQAIAALNDESGWGLDLRQQQRYAAALAGLHADGCHPALLRAIVVNYHLDHRQIEVLNDRQHHAHHQAWAAWMPQVFAVLRREGLAWADDGASDVDDFAQIASMALARALPEFRYESRYRSWAFAVIVRSVRNELRARQAKKRRAYLLSLDTPAAQEVRSPDSHHPESLASAAALRQLIGSILDAQPDRRLAQIFHLWAVEDRHMAEIGAQIGLSQSRVRVLLGQIGALLREDVRLRSWLADPELANTPWVPPHGTEAP